MGTSPGPLLFEDERPLVDQGGIDEASVMSGRRFKLGQVVRYYPGKRSSAESKQACVVIEMLR
jgi:hypothetical protein